MDSLKINVSDTVHIGALPTCVPTFEHLSPYYRVLIMPTVVWTPVLARAPAPQNNGRTPLAPE